MNTLFSPACKVLMIPPLIYNFIPGICVGIAAASVEDLHIKTIQKFASALVPSACSACCLPQLPEHQVQQFVLPHNRGRFTSATGKLPARAQTRDLPALLSYTQSSSLEQFKTSFPLSDSHLPLWQSYNSFILRQLKNQGLNLILASAQVPSLDPCLLILVFQGHIKVF